MAGIHRDIRQYFFQRVTRTEKKEIPETGTTTKPETNETSQQSEDNGKPDIRHININKNGFTQSKHNPVHTRPSSTTTKRKKARRFIKSTNVVNLSNYKLKQHEEQVLNKGLNFIPTPVREHPANIMQDYLLFDRKLRLQYYFKDRKDTILKEDRPFKLSTGWTPPASQDQNFDTYRNFTQKELLTELNYNPKYNRFNLTKKERMAIKTLAENSNIVIKPADKGGAIVIQNRSDYIAECERQLNNPDHYKKLHHNPTETLNNKILRTLQSAVQSEDLTEEEAIYLFRDNPRTSNFYTLPKIHKKNNPGRPIVNSIGSITEKLSEFVDENIKNLAQQVPSYIKDTTHFLTLIQDITTNPDDLLVTIDVSSLYTNIIHEEGLDAMEQWMIANNTSLQRANLIKTLGNLVLKNNYFEFNGNLYLQKQGTAMGTRMAPNYAIIYMHKIETELLQKTTLKPSFFKRFIDDIFLIWPHGEDTLYDFITMINSHHPTIKFTEEHSTTQIPFLDTLVYKEHNKLFTKVYHKKTDQKQYLHYKSNHPKNQKDAVPYGLLIRARRICTKDEDFKTEAISIVKSLMKRRYPQNILIEAFNKSWNKSQADLLIPKAKIKDNKIRLVTTFNQRNPPMRNILKKYDTWLDKTKKDIKSMDIQIVYRKARNLKQLLVKGKITSTPHMLGYSTNCNKPCVTCPRMNTSNTITSRNNVSYKIQGKFNCQSRYTVYVMECTLCKKQYVGETTQTINSRFRLHESFIKNKRENNIAEHFNLDDHTNTSYTITIVGAEEDKNKRLRLEEAWIHLLDTIQPKGLNLKL